MNALNASHKPGGRKTLLLALMLFLILLLPGKAQWVAFNDHAAGTATHANTTRYDVFGNGRETNGLLKSIATGAILPASVKVTRTGTGVSGAQAADNPAAGTLLQAVFGGFVDFAGSPSNSVELTGNGVVTYTFTGLNPDLRYSFKGSAVRGDPAYTNRWTLCEIAGANSYTADHSSTRVLTLIQVPSLAPSQAALNTGVNHTAGTGDYIGWTDIAPADDGSFSITCRQYSGLVPGGSSAGSKGYGLTGIRLEESPCPVPIALAIVLQPQKQTVIEGAPAGFDGGVTGCPVSYQWFKDGSRIPGAAAASYRISSTSTNDTGNYCVVVSNALGSVTSSVVRLAVYPNLSVPLVPLYHPWRYNQSGADLGNGWKDPDYNDSTWPMGLGVLGVEDSVLVKSFINTALSLVGTNGQPVITYYFRTHFTLTNNPDTVYLCFSNLVDDGAVVWLNGVELYRVNMDDGLVTAGTLARNATEGVFQVLSLVNSNLVQGDNVLAVEVHQTATTSADIVCGVSLNVVPLATGPVLIREQPEARVINAGDNAWFEVEATGQSPLAYQWRCNGLDLPGETNATLSLANAGIGKDGFYAVRVTNPFGSVRSRSARLLVNTPGWIPFYSTDFEQGAGAEWSVNRTEVTPAGGRRFLGQLGLESLSLSLSNLPAHQEAVVTFDLFLIKSWDGNSTGFIGPDEWKLEVVGGPELLHSTFSNWQTGERAEQCFPDRYLDDANPSLSGAEETNSLGYLHAGNPMDSVYRLTRIFSHSASQLGLRFSGLNLQGIADESWGLDNVKVYLGGTEPMRFVGGQITNGVFFVQLQGLAQDGSVVLESSADMSPGSWSPVLTNKGASVLLFLERTANHSCRFFRAVER